MTFMGICNAQHRAVKPAHSCTAGGIICMAVKHCQQVLRGLRKFTLFSVIIQLQRIYSKEVAEMKKYMHCSVVYKSKNTGHNLSSRSKVVAVIHGMVILDNYMAIKIY